MDNVKIIEGDLQVRDLRFAIAAARFLAVMRLAQHCVAAGKTLVRTRLAVADPAAIGEFALVAQRREDGVVEFA